MPDVAVNIAQTGLLTEVQSDTRYIAQDGLLAEVQSDTRYIAQTGLMAEVEEVAVVAHGRTFVVMIGA